MSGNRYKPDEVSYEDIEYDKEFDSYAQEVTGYDNIYYETDAYEDYNNAEPFNLEEDFKQEAEYTDNIQDYKHLNVLGIFTNRNLWDDSMLISAWDNSIKDYKTNINNNKSKKRKSKNTSQNDTIGFESELKNIYCETGEKVAHEKKATKNIKLDNKSDEKAWIESSTGADNAEPVKILQGYNMTTTKDSSISDNNYHEDNFDSQSFTENFVRNKQPKPPKPKNKKQLIEYLCNSNYYLGYYMGLLEENKNRKEI
ncbi:hypothetical protein AYI69_g888 [Smittium culicis]|uniref:Survival Motor Neuron Gemin2-binding domain-containing protein n=1 Tax=Smittium culicis TaxID=133412 RepID=A0A1R1YRT4_9FUNG|nr:hypothetical protein AYI69_g888 [Smittium culicis]